MTRSGRFATVLSGLAALVLTIVGLAIAATDTNPSGVDQLALGGYPPRVAVLDGTVSTGSLSLAAHVVVNFATNRVALDLTPPTTTGAGGVELRIIGNKLLLRSVTQGRWQEEALTQPLGDLYGLSLEMVKPDIALISGFDQDTVTTQGATTTYTFSRSVTASQAGERVSITTGSEGEVTALAMQVWGHGQDGDLSLAVTSYNRGGQIATPLPRDVATAVTTPASLRQVLTRFGLTLPQWLEKLIGGAA